jgi:hypothetical protein
MTKAGYEESSLNEAGIFGVTATVKDNNNVESVSTDNAHDGTE